MTTIATDSSAGRHNAGIEDALAEMFAKAFDLESVSIDDDFFQLGGDSLKGSLLTDAIEETFGLVVSLSILLEAPTPRALARAILEKSASRAQHCLVAINEDGTAPAIFCVHGNEGESMAPFRLSTVIGTRPFYAFRALGLEQDEEILLSAESIAVGYIAGMEKMRPGERSVILGHCSGATIAYEMARQLTSAGKPPAGLILIDPEADEEWAPFLHRSGLSLSLALATWRKRGAEVSATIGAIDHLTGEQRRKSVNAALRCAVGEYVPAPYEGPTLLLCSPEGNAALLDPRRGYPSLVKNLTVVEFQVRHRLMFTDGLAVVADAINGFVAGLAL